MATKSVTLAQYREMLSLLEDAYVHLEYCNYEDNWERECAKEDKLKQRLENGIEKARKFLDGNQ